MIAALDAKEEVVVWEPFNSRTKICAKLFALIQLTRRIKCPAVMTYFAWVDTMKIVAVCP